MAVARAQRRSFARPRVNFGLPDPRRPSRLSGVLCLAFSLLTSAVASCGDAGSNSTLGRVTGTVRDEQSGERLKGAHVVFTSDTLDREEGKTNEHGDYALTVASRVPNGRIQATKKGYQGRMVSVFLDSPDVEIDVDLAPSD